MKKLFSKSLLAKSLILKAALISCAFISSFTVSNVSFAQTIHVKMEGHVCPSCVDKTKSAISAIDENKVVESVNVDYKALTCEVKTKGDSNLSDDAIKAAIKEKGYNVVEIKRSAGECKTCKDKACKTCKNCKSCS